VQTKRVVAVMAGEWSFLLADAALPPYDSGKVDGTLVLLIDSSHKWWITVTLVLAALATGLFVWGQYVLPNGVTGNSAAGMAFGVVGSLLILFAFFLFFVRRIESWGWVPPRKSWLRGHIWLGLLSGLLIAFHSGFHLGGTLEWILWVVLGLVLATGVFGLVLQQFLPRRLTRRVACEVPYEQIPHVCAVLRAKAEGQYQELAKAQVASMSMIDVNIEIPATPSVDLQAFYETELWPFLGRAYLRHSRLADPLQTSEIFAELLSWPGLRARREALAQLETLCTERRLLAEEERLHRWLHAWLLVHVPLSFVLLLLGAAHAFFAIYY